MARRTQTWPITPRRLFQINIAVDFLLLGLALIFVAWPRQAMFIADLTSQIATIEYAAGDLGPRWGPFPVSEAPLLPGEPNPGATSCPDPRLVLDARLDRAITLRITAKEGLHLFLSTQDARGLGRLKCGNGKYLVAPKEVYASWKPEDAMLLTLVIDGRMSAGAVPMVDMLSSQTLKAGLLQVEASALPFKSGRARSDVLLRAGDELRFFASGDVEAISHGIVQYQDSLLHIIVRAKGSRAVINSVGQQDTDAIAVAPTVWDKIQAQSEWAVVLFCVALVLNMLGATQSYWSMAKDLR